MRLEKKLQIWQKNKLITAKSVEKILAFEKKNSLESHWMAILFCFAAFLVGLGVISLVAANWQEIPDIVKLCGALILLLVNAYIITELYSRNYKIAFTAFMCLFCFLIMATIGLIGQVYHLRSDFDRAMLFWSCLAFPLLFAQPALIWGWLPIFYFSATQKIQDVCSLPSSFIHTMAALAVVTVYETFANISKYAEGTVTRVLKLFSGAILLFLMMSYDNHWEMMRVSLTDFNTYALIMGSVIVVAVYSYLFSLKHERKTFMPMFLVGIAIFSSIKIAMLPTWWYCGVLALYAYHYHRPRLFNGAVLLAVFTVMSYYFDSDDLISAGLKLIVSGIIMATTLWGLHKYGKKLWDETA